MVREGSGGGDDDDDDDGVDDDDDGGVVVGYASKLQFLLQVWIVDLI